MPLSAFMAQTNHKYKTPCWAILRKYRFFLKENKSSNPYFTLELYAPHSCHPYWDVKNNWERGLKLFKFSQLKYTVTTEEHILVIIERDDDIRKENPFCKVSLSSRDVLMLSRDGFLDSKMS